MAEIKLSEVLKESDRTIKDAFQRLEIYVTEEDEGKKIFVRPIKFDGGELLRTSHEYAIVTNMRGYEPKTEGLHPYGTVIAYLFRKI